MSERTVTFTSQIPNQTLHRVGGRPIRFNDGIFSSSDAREIAYVRSHWMFDGRIQEVPEGKAPVAKPTAKPKAKRSAVSTKDTHGTKTQGAQTKEEA